LQANAIILALAILSLPNNHTDFKRIADDSQLGKREIKTCIDTLSERQSMPPKLNPFLNTGKTF